MNNERKAVNVKTASIKDLKRAFYRKIPIQGIEMLVTHPAMHAEEFGSIALCHLGYAETRFPGIKKANVGMLSSTKIRNAREQLDGVDATPQGFFFYMMKEYRMLVFGVGKGVFDEHGKEGESSSLMIFARHLGVEDKKELQSLLTFFDWEDSHGTIVRHVKETPTADRKVINAAGKFLFPEMVKRTFRSIKDKPEEEQNLEVQFLMRQVEYVVLEQLKYGQTQKELRGEIDYQWLPQRPRNKKGKEQSDLAIVRTDNNQAQGAVWVLSKHRKHSVAAILQINTTGQFQLIANQDSAYEVRLQDAVRMLRMYEFQAKGLRIPRWNELGQESVEGSVIHYQVEAERVYNGSLTQQDVPPLIADGLLAEEKVIEAVMIGLQHHYRDKVHEDTCKGRNGICPVKASGGEIKCPLYQAGLFRCYTTQKHTESGNKVGSGGKRKKGKAVSK